MTHAYADQNIPLAELHSSWKVALRAQGKSQNTVEAYSAGVLRFLAWCTASGTPPALDRPTVSAFIDSLLNGGAERTTAQARQLALRRFSSWLAEEGEIESDELLALKPVKTHTKVTPELSDDECSALIKACEGTDFRDRRDAAIVRLMIETGARAGEVADLGINDIDLRNQLAIIRRGKGGRARTVPFGAKAAQALDRYIRVRRRHRLAQTPALWLGERSYGFSYEGLYRALCRRADLAGIKEFHPHVLRHTAAARWLAAGGSEQGLMSVAGWRNRSMLDRYTQASSERRAADEARRLGLGDL
jgi:site-specific recombinase XerD